MQSILFGIVKKVLEWIASLIKKVWDRKKEQTDRHEENKDKTDAYKEATDTSARDHFSDLP